MRVISHVDGMPNCVGGVEPEVSEVSGGQVMPDGTGIVIAWAGRQVSDQGAEMSAVAAVRA